MNKNLLRGKIVENGLTVQKFVKKVGFAPSTFNKKLRGETVFTVGEVMVIAKNLSLTLDDVNRIFFDDIIPKMGD